MFGNKGYRAREAAAKLRNTRKLVTDDVRAARTGVLPDNVVTNSTEVEVALPVADETNTPTEAELAAADLAAAAAAAEAAAAEQAKKEAAEKAAAEEKAKGKHGKKGK